MAYHILMRIITFMRIPLVYGSSAPLDDLLYHKNVPMIIRSLGSNGYLSFERSEFLIDTSQKKSLRVCRVHACTRARVFDFSWS